jgi:membrane-bound lytic murein transglycosylase B
MGKNQFMPSCFFSYAQDGDGDGKRDIWKNHDDIFASTANYLKKSGWKKGQLWGEEIALPAKFDSKLVGLDTKRKVTEWEAMGIKVSGRGSDTASIIQPDGAGGKAYMVYNNFRVFMRWNKSQSFAAAAGTLSEIFKNPKPQPAAAPVTPPPASPQI